jgi:hypothetical protein
MEGVFLVSAQDDSKSRTAKGRAAKAHRDRKGAVTQTQDMGLENTGCGIGLSQLTTEG